VIIAGGREAPHWEAYPTHQFLHTVGLLPCCATGGCWRSRTVPLGDHDEKDAPEHLCRDVVDDRLPRCMDMISVEQVIERMETIIAAQSGWSLVTADTPVSNPADRPYNTTPLTP
jgi:hypothetical protein